MKTAVLKHVGRGFAAPFEVLPFAFQRVAVEAALNHAFHRSIRNGDLGFLEGRTILLTTDNHRWCWPLTLTRGRIRLLHVAPCADTVIRGSFREFLALAGGLADPDTLFFQRRIVMEGDTELGLALKNFLDGVDFEDSSLRTARSLRRTLRIVWSIAGTVQDYESSTEYSGISGQREPGRG